MGQNVTKETEQAISNKSFDPTYQVEIVKLLGYDADVGVLRPIAVDSSGQIKVV